MKSKNVYIPILFLLCLSCMLSSCSKPKGPMEGLYCEDAYDFFDTPLFQECKELTQFAGWKLAENKNGTFFRFCKDGRQVIYNAILDRTLLEVAGEAHSFFFEKLTNGAYIFWHCDRIAKQITLYQADGERIVSKSYDANAFQAPTVLLDLICYDHSYYRVLPDGSVTHAFDKHPMEVIPERIDYSVAGYYYMEDPDTSAITVYDSNLKMAATFRAPSYAYRSTYNRMPLSNGYLLIQYKVLLPQDSTTYDLFCDGSKFDLVSLILDPQSNTTRELELPYVLVDGYSRGHSSYEKEMARFAHNVENLVKAYDIKDGYFDRNELRLYAISEEGAIEQCLNDLVPDQGDNLPVPISASYWTLKNQRGQIFLLDAFGNLICELPEDAIVNEACIYYQNAIYDHERNLLYEYSEPMDVVAVYESCILLYGTESKNTYLFSNGESKPLITQRGGLLLYLYDRRFYFYTENPGTRNNRNFYRIYNEEGRLVAHLASYGWISPCGDLENGVMLVGTTEGEEYHVNTHMVHYYRLG